MKKLLEKIRNNNKGFTLVELIVVIAVLAIITVVVAPQYIKYVEKARVGTDENAIGEIAHIAEVEYVELAAQGLVDETAGETITVNCNKPYTVTSANTNLQSEVAGIMGSYDVKSKEYDGKSVTITISPNGVATWGPATEGGSNGGGNSTPTPTPVEKCSKCNCQDTKNCDHTYRSGYNNRKCNTCQATWHE